MDPCNLIPICAQVARRWTPANLYHFGEITWHLAWGDGTFPLHRTQAALEEVLRLITKAGAKPWNGL
jgi:hypothetical protein